MTACFISSFDPLSRSQQRQAFLNRHGYGVFSCSLLAADCSPRQYYRLQKNNQSVVLMDTPPTEHPEQFCRLSHALNTSQLSAPKILEADLEQGFILLEDFGDHTYTRVLTPHNTKELYTLAVDTLIHLHQSFKTAPLFIDAYTVDTFLREAHLFLEWYYPTLSRPALSDKAKHDYQTLLKTALTHALTDQPLGLVLRDYHVDNLIYLPARAGIQQCGLLDFQCALWGPLGYDFVSLVEDARRDVAPALKDHLWQHYLAAMPGVDPLAFRQASAVFSLGRHLKILGIFAWQAVSYGRPQYLTHIPRVRRLISTSLIEAEIPELKGWFEEYLPDDD